MSHKCRWEYFKAIFGRYRAIFGRYRQADRRPEQMILAEFCSNTRYNRK
jgi:hypothetical protein